MKFTQEPAIFNTDQGSQFTSERFIKVLKEHYIEISMDGKGRALDNIYAERLWRSLKYEDIYLKLYGTMGELKEGIKRYFMFTIRSYFINRFCLCGRTARRQVNTILRK